MMICFIVLKSVENLHVFLFSSYLYFQISIPASGIAFLLCKTLFLRNLSTIEAVRFRIHAK